MKIEQHFNQILDAISDLVLIKGEKSKILWANRAFCEYYGMSNEQLNGIIDAPFNEPDYTQQYIKDDSHVFETGKTLNIPEEKVTRHDGYVGVFNTVKSAIKDSSGIVIMTVGISREITALIEEKRQRLAAEAEVLRRTDEIKETNLKLVAANEQLKELDVLKTNFFANISHEFRTPLTLMLGPLEDSLSDLVNPLQPEQRLRQELILKNALRLLKLVNSLLDFSRIEAGRMEATYEPTNLGKLTRELASHFESVMAKAGLKYTIKAQELDEPVFVDRDMWEKIVLNLLSNAFKFTMNGEIFIELKREGDFAELLVRDTGVGIPEKDLPHVFRRFYRVEGSRGRSYEGTGIGLALIQELVKMHGGTIEVTSKVDGGSTFIVKIPLGVAHLPANQLRSSSKPVSFETRAEAFADEASRWLPEGKSDTKPDPKIPSVKIPSGKILIADDNIDMRAYVESLLKPYWAVTSVNDGEQAYDELTRGGYDLVLSDVMMPRLDGFALVKKLRENPVTQTISVILISARAGEESTVAGIQMGADDYLVKPFSSKELLARVKTNLEMKRLRDESLKLSEGQLKLALKSAQMGTWSWDFKTNQVFRDGIHQRLFGYSAGTFPGVYEAFEKALHPDDRDQVKRLLKEAIDDRSMYNSEFRIRWPDGSIHWVQAFGQGLYDDFGKPYRMLGIIHDITKRKQDEEALKKAIKVRDEFLMIASHELKTPITALKMQLQISRRGVVPEMGTVPPADKLAKSIDISMIQVDRLTKLIDDMLDVSRMQSGKLSLELSPVNLASIIRDLVERFSAELNSAKCQIDVDAAQDIIGSWDKTRIEQVLANLLSNAIKYAAGTKILITALKDKQKARLTVQDNGPGIPKEKHQIIFERFERAASRNIGGLGLGLYICRKIVEAHGGTIQVESEEGTGTRFIVELPLFASVGMKREGISFDS